MARPFRASTLGIASASTGDVSRPSHISPRASTETASSPKVGFYLRGIPNIIAHAMGRSITAAFRDALVHVHFERYGTPPTDRQLSGYKKIAGQVERFYLQFKTVRDLDRCRQILFANIPKICGEHGTEAAMVYEMLDHAFMLDSGEAYVFYHQVEAYHRMNPSPVSPSVGGCLIVVAALLLPALLGVSAIGASLL